MNGWFHFAERRWNHKDKKQQSCKPYYIFGIYALITTPRNNSSMFFSFLVSNKISLKKKTVKMESKKINKKVAYEAISIYVTK